MRIIITRNGENARLEIARTISQTNIKHSNRLQSTESHHQIDGYNSKTIKFIPTKMKKKSSQCIYKHEEIKIQPTLIKIKKPKLNACVIQAVEESKFHKAMSNMKLKLLPTCERDKLEEINSNRNKENKETPRQEILIRDIIDPDAIKKMIFKINKDNELKKKHYKMTHLDFRSVAKANKSFYEKMNDTLDKKISSKGKCFIKYVKNKKEVSNVFLNNLCELDDARLSNLDRLCKLIEVKEETKPIRIGKRNDNTKFKGQEEYDEMRKTMVKLEDQFLFQNTLINKYKRNLNQKRAIDEDYYDQTKSYWKKHKVNDLQRRGKSRSMRCIHVKDSAGTFG